jgi:hypothetical protein
MESFLKPKVGLFTYLLSNAPGLHHVVLAANASQLFTDGAMM